MFGPPGACVDTIFPADADSAVAQKFNDTISTVLCVDDYNILEASPELSGSMASKLLKSTDMQRFFDRYKHVIGPYHYGPGHPCNSENVVGDLWKEFSWSLVFMRESGLRGLEPLSQEWIEKCDQSLRKQRVWIGTISPTDNE